MFQPPCYTEEDTKVLTCQDVIKGCQTTRPRSPVSRHTASHSCPRPWPHDTSAKQPLVDILSLEVGGKLFEGTDHVSNSSLHNSG